MLPVHAFDASLDSADTMREKRERHLWIVRLWLLGLPKRKGCPPDEQERRRDRGSDNEHPMPEYLAAPERAAVAREHIPRRPPADRATECAHG